MSIVFGVLGFAVFVVLVAFGRAAMIQENDKRVTDWARSQGVSLLRVDRDVMYSQHERPTWRIRCRTSSGETRDAVAKAGWSIYDPIEVQWAKPGDSVFR